MRKLNFYLLLFVFCFVNISNSVLRAETVTYYINDVLGSPVAAMDQSGRLLWRESYNPFGEGRKKPSQNANDIGFTGHQKDDATGLTYMQARYYDPTIGRFYGIDPVGYTSKNPVMSFNKYIYVNNNPYKYTDPTGEFFFVLFLVPELIALADALLVVTAILVVGAAATEIVQNSDNGSDEVLQDGEGATEEELNNSSNPEDPTSGKPVTKKERDQILSETKKENDGKNKCWRCGYESENDDEFHIGHRNTPKSKGGTKHSDNLRCEGKTCNQSAGNRGKPKTSCQQNNSCQNDNNSR